MAARDIIQAAAGAAGATEANYIEDVFSTWLYNGTETARTISNGIDLSTKGGMVWIKSRTTAEIPNIYDTARGAQKMLYTSGNLSEYSRPNGLTAFNTTGFSLGIDGNYELNSLSTSYASWTFRKQPKFFDVVTYTGDGDNGRQIAHNLGCVPGMVIIKKTSTTGAWSVWHKGSSISSSIFGLSLNATSAAYLTTDATGQFTSTVFTPYYVQDAGATSQSNQSGQTYVAYLFADSNSGGFGPAGTDSVVACGSFTASSLTSVSLGWEPQFVLLKKSSFIGDWYLLDVMRGLDQTNSQYLRANSSSIEGSNPTPIIPTATGFNYIGTNFNDTSGTYIYLAIRRGPMKTPTDATKVFATTKTNSSSGTVITTGLAADLSVIKYLDGADIPRWHDRLRGYANNVGDVSSLLRSSGTDAEISSTGAVASVWNTGFKVTGTLGGLNSSYYSFRRAPGFFDVVCYTGTGSATTVAHNLGVAPELMLVKSRGASAFWRWYWAPLGATKNFYMPNNEAAVTQTEIWNNTAPTSSVFTVGTSSGTNLSNYTYVAYLFATCPGVSKVFSFTGNGSSQTIDCGFTSGARFVLIKRTDSTGDWWVYDSARGIVSAADPALQLNSTAAEVTSADAIDPASSGFIVNQEATCNVNVNNATYIGLAIA